MKKDIVLAWLCIFLFVVSFIGWARFFKDNEDTTIETRTVDATLIRLVTFDDDVEIFVTVRISDCKTTETWSIVKSNSAEILTVLRQHIGEQLTFEIFGIDETDPYVKKGVKIINVSTP